MVQSSGLAGLVQERLDSFFSEQRRELHELGPDIAPLIDVSHEFLSGGKRLRAQFCASGFAAVAGSLDPMAPDVPDYLVDVATSLELFHAAALIHDDIIDQSDTRRGKPAVHKAFESRHTAQRWRSNPARYGVASAILIGDLLQSWSDQTLSNAIATLSSPLASAARAHFNRMRTEVAAGQYLDVLEEQMGALVAETEQLERATRVLVFKSAKYSVEAPLLLGGSLAGANDQQEAALRDFGLPIGVAFQLRDDILGVFGDAEVTGKPSGDDLREGKRTVLVGLTRQQLNVSARNVFDELLGDPSLNAEQIDMLQKTMRESGAVDAVESMIDTNVKRALGVLETADFSTAAKAQLSELAKRATQRAS